jgi:hypothetical protein
METYRPRPIAKNVATCGLIAAGFWVVVPLLDLLRVGFASPDAGHYFGEAIGRAFVSVIGLGALCWAMEKVLGSRVAPQRNDGLGRP